MDEIKLDVLSVTKVPEGEVSADQISSITFTCCDYVDVWDGLTAESYDAAEDRHYTAHPECFCGS